jgi:hypothetical protein
VGGAGHTPFRTGYTSGVVFRDDPESFSSRGRTMNLEVGGVLESERERVTALGGYL